MNNKSFLGTGWAFPPAFIKNQGAEMVSEEEDIEQSLKILFSTNLGERIFRFDYGCNIRQWIFDDINLSTKTLMSETIEQAILDFEPRINVEKIEIETKDFADGILWINIEYSIPKINSRKNMVFPFYFKEGTNLK
jgi:phage baseplate assembly protein W